MELKPRLEPRAWPYLSSSCSELTKSDPSLSRTNPTPSEFDQGNNENKHRRVIKTWLSCVSTLSCVSIAISLITLFISIYVVVYTVNMNCDCLLDRNVTVANVERDTIDVNMTFPDPSLNYTVLVNEIHLLKADIESLKKLLNNVTSETGHKIDENTRAIASQAQFQENITAKTILKIDENTRAIASQAQLQNNITAETILKIDENTRAIASQAQFQENITAETILKIDENTRAIASQAQLQENITAETNHKLDENSKTLTNQAQLLSSIEDQLTSVLENNITSLFKLLSNMTTTTSTAPVGKGTATLEDLPSFQDALHNNCTFTKLSSCTLSTTAQYGSAIPTFWSCKTNPISITGRLGTVQCIVTEYGSEINPIGASLSLTEVNGVMEYRCLCSVVVATTIWRQSSVTCSLVESYCIANDTVNITLSYVS